MTAYLVFERIADGRLAMDDLITVSEKAWRMGGSKMWIEVGEQVRVEDMLRGLIVQSGNDAAVAFAEALAGSEDAFAEEMNRKAKELGLEQSHFRNSTGWPDPEHLMTARDLAMSGASLILDFPQFYRTSTPSASSPKDYDHAVQPQPAARPRIGRRRPEDRPHRGGGLRPDRFRPCSDGRRLILVVNGLPSEKARGRGVRAAARVGLSRVQHLRLFSAGEMLDEAQVWHGRGDRVPLVARRTT